VQRKIKDYADCFHEGKQAQGVFLKEREAYEQAELAYGKAYRLFLAGQAGLLAEELEAGSPCPVCGSTEHPKPAEKPRETPSEAELKQLEEARKHCQERAERAAKQHSALKERLSQQKQQLSEQDDSGEQMIAPRETWVQWKGLGMLEVPEKLMDRPEQLLRRVAYMVSYNSDLRIPNWVAWKLTTERIEREITCIKY